MSRSLSRLQAVLLGLVVLTGLALGGVGLFAVGSRGWFGKDALHVRAGFPEIRGVEVGTRVRIQGIDAGEVVQINPPDGPSGPVVLRLRLRGDYRHLVRAGSTVQIVSEGMLGGKVVEIRPPRPLPAGSPPDLRPAEEDALLRAEPAAELADVVGQVSTALGGLARGEGTLGKLLKDPRAYDALLTLLTSGTDAVERSKETMASIKHDADAIKELPIIRGYVKDAVKILVRPDCEKNRRVFAEAELFEPGRAALTAGGRARLDELGPWLTGLRHKGSEVVVVSYADPRGPNTRTADAVTRQQSEAVAEYLKKHHSAHKLGLVSWRKVTTLGLGTQAPPEPEPSPLPRARVEVVVFVPQT